MTFRIPPAPVNAPPGGVAWNDWYERLRYLLNNDLIDHNLLDGLQGGTTNQYYHLTAAQAATITATTTVTTVTVSTVLTSANGTVLVDTTSNNITITLPDATTTEGRMFYIKRLTAGAYTLTVATGGGNIDNAATASIAAQYESITLTSDGTDYWIV